MSTILPERISQARELRGFTKSEVAESLSVTPAAVAQWENGAKSPSPENLARFSLLVGFPIATFERPMPADALRRRGPLSFRAKSSASTKRVNLQADQLSQLVSEAYSWLCTKVELPKPRIPEVSTSADPEEAASLCRKAWNLGDRPILRLGELVEASGIILTRVVFSSTKIDAFSCHVTGRPYIFLGSNKGDRARSRFDTAHELGHLVLHQHYSGYLNESEEHTELEKQADRFASAFLLPASTFGNEIIEPSLKGFLRLKQRWGVSVQAMVYRAADLGIINSKRKTELFRQISYKGWRKAKGEPLDEMVPDTLGQLGKRSIELLAVNGVIKPWEISGELPLPREALRIAFGLDPVELKDAESPNLVLLRR